MKMYKHAYKILLSEIENTLDMINSTISAQSKEKNTELEAVYSNLVAAVQKAEEMIIDSKEEI
ncbi:MAG: hypothetical protein J6B17_00605 [Ruminococcus sp.]|nr:hypothetical protein [Ruminococcus sp.]